MPCSSITCHLFSKVQCNVFFMKHCPRAPARTSVNRYLSPLAVTLAYFPLNGSKTDSSTGTYGQLQTLKVLVTGTQTTERTPQTGKARRARHCSVPKPLRFALCVTQLSLCYVTNSRCTEMLHRFPLVANGLSNKAWKRHGMLSAQSRHNLILMALNLVIQTEPESKRDRVGPDGVAQRTPFTGKAHPLHTSESRSVSVTPKRTVAPSSAVM